MTLLGATQANQKVKLNDAETLQRIKQKSRAGDNYPRGSSLRVTAFKQIRLIYESASACLNCSLSHGASIIGILSSNPIHFLPPGAGWIMTPKLNVLLLLILAVATVTVLAQRRRPTAATDNEWNYRDGCEHPDYSLFTLGQRSSAGLIMVMSKREVKDDSAASLLGENLYECLFVFMWSLTDPTQIEDVSVKAIRGGTDKVAQVRHKLFWGNWSTLGKTTKKSQYVRHFWQLVYWHRCDVCLVHGPKSRHLPALVKLLLTWCLVNLYMNRNRTNEGFWFSTWILTFRL